MLPLDKADRKTEVMRPYHDVKTAPGRSRVAAIEAHGFGPMLTKPSDRAFTPSRDPERTDQRIHPPND
jgi:hypothetical protein